MAGPPRFLCDGMLGSLARWMRLLGFDTAYAESTLTDEQVLQRCIQEGRSLLTRDAQLRERAAANGRAAFDAGEGSVEDQVRRLVQAGTIRLHPERFFTRCTRCNGDLASTPVASVRDRLPPRILELHAEFWMCNACGQIYWKGTHVDEILKRLNRMDPQMPGRA